MAEEDVKMVPLSQYLAFTSTQHSLVLKRVFTLPYNDLLRKVQQSTPGQSTAQQQTVLLAVPVGEIQELQFASSNDLQTRARASGLQDVTRASDSRKERSVPQANDSLNRNRAKDSQGGTRAKDSLNGNQDNKDSHNRRPMCANCSGSPTSDIELPQLLTFGVFTNDILLY